LFGSGFGCVLFLFLLWFVRVCSFLAGIAYWTAYRSITSTFVAIDNWQPCTIISIHLLLRSNVCNDLAEAMKALDGKKRQIQLNWRIWRMAASRSVSDPLKWDGLDTLELLACLWFACPNGHDMSLYICLSCFCSCKDRAFSATSATLEEKKTWSFWHALSSSLVAASISLVVTWHRVNWVIDVLSDWLFFFRPTPSWLPPGRSTC